MGDLFIDSPFALDGWLEFNRRKWGVTPQRVRLTAKDADLPRVDAVLYRDGSGRLRLPPRNPYIPITIRTSDTKSPSRLYRQTLEVTEMLVDAMVDWGLRGAVGLDPRIQDVRPWVWRGFVVRPRYTFYVDLPFDPEASDKTFRKRNRVAERRGFYVRVHAPLQDVFECLRAAEERQGFTHQLRLRDLEIARDLLGRERFRTYVAYAKDGTPASARVALHVSGTRAVGWVAGTKPEYLKDGVAQYMLVASLQDLFEVGAIGFDYVGANIKTVAAAKANAGGRLVTYYSVEQRNPRYIAKELLATARGQRRRNS